MWWPVKLADSRIQERCEQNELICPFDEKLLGSSSYDLTIQDIIVDKEGTKKSQYKLESGESVFISTAQTVNIPNDLIGLIENKTWRVRQGLEVLATPHQPGISTRIFIKVTNTSPDEIKIEANEKIAQIYFEAIKGLVNQPYDGAFNNEDNYKGLSTYNMHYRTEVFEEKLKQKTLSLEKIESKLYGVVAALMAVFVAIMSIIMSGGTSNTDNPVASMLVSNLMVVSSISFLFGVISLFIPKSTLAVHKPTITCFILSAIAFFLCFLISPEVIPPVIRNIPAIRNILSL